MAELVACAVAGALKALPPGTLGTAYIAKAIEAERPLGEQMRQQRLQQNKEGQA